MFKLTQIFATWLFGLARWKKRLLQITFDFATVPLALLLAFFLRLETAAYLFKLDTYIGVLIAIIANLTVFAVRGLYNNLARHISIETATSIIIGCLVSCAALLSATLLLELQIPSSVPLIYATILCFFSTTARFLIRGLGRSMAKKSHENVAIYGAGYAGIQLMRAMRQDQNYRVKFFIDDSPELVSKNIGGVKILSFNEAKKKFKELNIRILLLASPMDGDATRRRAFDILSDYPLKVKAVPSISSLISDRAKITELTDIKIEDLLGREQISHNPELMAKTIAEKTVLVTGAGGSIGSELCQQIILWKPKKLILLDVSEFATYTLLEKLKQHPSSNGIDLTPLIGSVQDREFVKKIFYHFCPDTIYHAAAYKHVPLMEQNVMQCIANNVFGTLNVAELAMSAKVKHFILISTDKAVNPTNFMGASKRIAEIICQALSTQNTNTCFAIVRFGNVLGSSGSVVPLFKKQIEKGGPITLTHTDITRYFMTISEAAQLVIQSGSIAQGGEVFVLDMGKPIKILDLAKKMAILSGLRPVLSVSETLKDDEIAINISGLRPGEKLFEELSYNSNLIKTIHSRIMKSVEVATPLEDLKISLSGLRAALDANDHKLLSQITASINSEMSKVTTSNDMFFRTSGLQQNDLVPAVTSVTN